MNANEVKHEARVAEWTERVRECRSSGLSVKAWCAGQGIKTATYYRWEHEVLTRADSGTNHEMPEGHPVFAELPEAVIHKEEAGGKGASWRRWKPGRAWFTFMRGRTQKSSGRCAGRRYAERLHGRGAYLHRLRLYGLASRD